MSNMVLQCKDSSRPHPEGIHAAVCVDVVDLGLVEVEFQGQRRMVNKVKLVFESEAKDEEGKACTVSRNFTASLHPKARLAEFLGKWRGRLVVPGETIDLAKLIGACATLVVSHQQNMVGRTYASIDAISKPTKRTQPSGQYDPVDMRRRIAEAMAGGPAAAKTVAPSQPQAPAQRPPPAPVPLATTPAQRQLPTSAPAPTPTVAPDQSFDPDVGF